MCQVDDVSTWIRCFAADWQGAERVWAEISKRKLTPNSYSYRALMQVYTHAGGEQLAKIDRLLSAMHHANVQLSVMDFEKLI